MKAAELFETLKANLGYLEKEYGLRILDLEKSLGYEASSFANLSDKNFFNSKNIEMINKVAESIGYETNTILSVKAESLPAPKFSQVVIEAHQGKVGEDKLMKMIRHSEGYVAIINPDITKEPLRNFKANFLYLLDKYKIDTNSLAKTVDVYESFLTSFVTHPKLAPSIQIIHNIADTLGYKVEELITSNPENLRKPEFSARYITNKGLASNYKLIGAGNYFFTEADTEYRAIFEVISESLESFQHKANHILHRGERETTIKNFHQYFEKLAQAHHMSVSEYLTKHDVPISENILKTIEYKPVGEKLKKTSFNLQNNLKYISENYGLNVYSWERALGVRPLAIHSIIEGTNTSPNINTIANIARSVGLSVDDLLTSSTESLPKPKFAPKLEQVVKTSTIAKVTRGFVLGAGGLIVGAGVAHAADMGVKYIEEKNNEGFDSSNSGAVKKIVTSWGEIAIKTLAPVVRSVNVLYKVFDGASEGINQAVEIGEISVDPSRLHLYTPWGDQIVDTTIIDAVSTGTNAAFRGIYKSVKDEVKRLGSLSAEGFKGVGTLLKNLSTEVGPILFNQAHAEVDDTYETDPARAIALHTNQMHHLLKPLYEQGKATSHDLQEYTIRLCDEMNKLATKEQVKEVTEYLKYQQNHLHEISKSMADNHQELLKIEKEQSKDIKEIRAVQIRQEQAEARKIKFEQRISDIEGAFNIAGFAAHRIFGNPKAASIIAKSGTGLVSAYKGISAIRAGGWSLGGVGAIVGGIGAIMSIFDEPDNSTQQMMEAFQGMINQLSQQLAQGLEEIKWRLDRSDELQFRTQRMLIEGFCQLHKNDVMTFELIHKFYDKYKRDFKKFEAEFIETARTAQHSINYVSTQIIDLKSVIGDNLSSLRTEGIDELLDKIDKKKEHGALSPDDFNNLIGKIETKVTVTAKNKFVTGDASNRNNSQGLIDLKTDQLASIYNHPIFSKINLIAQDLNSNNQALSHPLILALCADAMIKLVEHQRKHNAHPFNDKAELEVTIKRINALYKEAKTINKAMKSGAENFGNIIADYQKALANFTSAVAEEIDNNDTELTNHRKKQFAKVVADELKTWEEYKSPEFSKERYDVRFSISNYLHRKSTVECVNFPDIQKYFKQAPKPKTPGLYNGPHADYKVADLDLDQINVERRYNARLPELLLTKLELDQILGNPEFEANEVKSHKSQTFKNFEKNVKEKKLLLSNEQFEKLKKIEKSLEIDNVQLNEKIISFDLNQFISQKEIEFKKLKEDGAEFLRSRAEKNLSIMKIRLFASTQHASRPITNIIYSRPSKAAKLCFLADPLPSGEKVPEDIRYKTPTPLLLSENNMPYFVPVKWHQWKLSPRPKWDSLYAKYELITGKQIKYRWFLVIEYNYKNYNKEYEIYTQSFNIQGYIENNNQEEIIFTYVNHFNVFLGNEQERIYDYWYGGNYNNLTKDSNFKFLMSDKIPKYSIEIALPTYKVDLRNNIDKDYKIYDLNDRYPVLECSLDYPTTLGNLPYLNCSGVFTNFEYENPVDTYLVKTEPVREELRLKFKGRCGARLYGEYFISKIMFRKRANFLRSIPEQKDLDPRYRDSMSQRKKDYYYEELNAQFEDVMGKRHSRYKQEIEDQLNEWRLKFNLELKKMLETPGNPLYNAFINYCAMAEKLKSAGILIYGEKFIVRCKEIGLPTTQDELLDYMQNYKGGINYLPNIFAGLKEKVTSELFKDLKPSFPLLERTREGLKLCKKHLDTIFLSLTDVKHVEKVTEKITKDPKDEIIEKLQEELKIVRDENKQKDTKTSEVENKLSDLQAQMAQMMEMMMKNLEINKSQTRS